MQMDGKAVVHQSTVHDDNAVDESSQKKKPEVDVATLDADTQLYRTTP